jgi:hypothetical protein
LQKKKTAMPLLRINKRDGYSWQFGTEDGHLYQTELYDQQRIRRSLGAWLDAVSAKKALLDGEVNWGDWGRF